MILQRIHDCSSTTCDLFFALFDILSNRACPKVPEHSLGRVGAFHFYHHIFNMGALDIVPVSLHDTHRWAWSSCLVQAGVITGTHKLTGRVNHADPSACY